MGNSPHLASWIGSSAPWLDRRPARQYGENVVGTSVREGFEPLESPDDYHQYDSAGSDPKDGGDSLPATRWVGHVCSCDQSERPGSHDGDAGEDEDDFEEDSH